MNEPTPNVPTLRINTLTAGPLFRLLLALEGMEPPAVDPGRGWQVFERFIALPSESGRDLASFQATWGPDPEARDTLFCTLARQLTDGLETAVEVTRSIQLEYSFGLPWSEEYDDVEVWSDEFDSLQEFTAQVEQLPHFRLLLERAPSTCEVYVEEE